MKCFTNWLSMLLVATLLAACDSKTSEKTEATTDTTVATNPIQPDLNSDQSELLESILGTSGGEGSVIRGISFGDPVNKVKASETFEMFEETEDHLGYTAETPKLETIDIQYFLTPEKTVNRITVDVYLNSADATKRLWDASKSHFNEAYSLGKEKPKKISWDNKSIGISIEDVSKGKDFGLKFEFSQTNKNVLAVK